MPCKRNCHKLPTTVHVLLNRSTILLCKFVIIEVAYGFTYNQLLIIIKITTCTCTLYRYM